MRQDMGVEQGWTGAVLPFRAASGRPARRPFGDDEPRGEILLFTGVRYERQSEPGPTSPNSPLAAGRPGSRRRRS